MISECGMSCLSLHHNMTVQCVCNHGIRFPGRFLRLLKLRFRPSFFPGSHHVPWQHKYTKCLRKHSQHQVPCFKKQNASHAHNNSNMKIPQSSQSRTTSTFLHDVSLRSASNSEFWCLHERCSRHRHWETYNNKTNLKQLTKPICRQNCVHCVNQRVSPPFKLKSDACAQPCRHFWKQQVNLERTNQLFSCR